MEVIEIYSGSTKALVDPNGAWLTNLSDDNGDILFPKRLLIAPDGSQKARGGCHVCLPNFGPGGESNLPQHGFGRTLLWEVGTQLDNRIELELVGGSKEYETLCSTLIYEVHEGSITIVLRVENNGAQPLRVAPGFHPYFSLRPDEVEIEVTGEKFNLAELPGTLYREGQKQKLVTAKRTITISSKNLSTWAVWTDQLGSYVCVEPTSGGNAFLDDQSNGTIALEQGSHVQYSATITWR